MRIRHYAQWVLLLLLLSVLSTFFIFLDDIPELIEHLTKDHLRTMRAIRPTLNLLATRMDQLLAEGKPNDAIPFGLAALSLLDSKFARDDAVEYAGIKLRLADSHLDAGHWRDAAMMFREFYTRSPKTWEGTQLQKDYRFAIEQLSDSVNNMDGQAPIFDVEELVASLRLLEGPDSERYQDAVSLLQSLMTAPDTLEEEWNQRLAAADRLPSEARGGLGEEWNQGLAAAAPVHGHRTSGQN